MPLAGDGSPPEMDLLVYIREPLGRLARSEVRRWLETVYRDVYHCSPDDPRLAQMVAALPDPYCLTEREERTDMESNAAVMMTWSKPA